MTKSRFPSFAFICVLLSGLHCRWCTHDGSCAYRRVGVCLLSGVCCTARWTHWRFASNYHTAGAVSLKLCKSALVAALCGARRSHAAFSKPAQSKPTVNNIPPPGWKAKQTLIISLKRPQQFRFTILLPTRDTFTKQESHSEQNSKSENTLFTMSNKFQLSGPL